MPIIIVPATVTINYEENEGSPKEGINEKGPFATRELICDWGDRWTLATQLAGSISISGATTTRTLPAAYPHRNNCYCNGVGITPFDDGRPTANGGTDVKTATYTKALVTASFESGTVADPAASGDGADVLVEESIEPFAEFITLPAEGFKWEGTSDVLRAEEAPGKLFKGFNWIYDIHYASRISDETYSLVGMVNSGAIRSRSLQFTFDPETLLYNPPLLRRQITTEGVQAWSIRLAFGYKPMGWNNFWHNAAQGWFRIVTSAGAPANPYQSGNFLPLIFG